MDSANDAGEHLLEYGNNGADDHGRTPDSYCISRPDLLIEEILPSDETNRRTRLLLYTSHFLSTWNSRVFEFGAFLFLAKIYPQTLLPASVYALARATAAALLSPWLGPYIDKTDRLSAVRVSIAGQRLAVAASCALLFLMTQLPDYLLSHALSTSSLTALSLLACVEKLSWILNTIAVERDWVIVVAGGNEERLRVLNSQMRRIDLFCKLVGPFVLALIDNASTRTAVLVTAAMTILSVVVEYFTIAKVYHMIPALRVRNTNAGARSAKKETFISRVMLTLHGTTVYARHPAFLPSFALALLYLTVLSFNGQMVTYLIALGLSSGLIGVLRGVSAAFELSATWLGPKIMARIGPVRAGIWFLNSEIVCVAVACFFFWLDTTQVVAAFGTVVAVVVSRIGLWGFDLCAQVIVQEEVEAERRGIFSAQEFALQSIFEMLAFGSTVVFPRPSQFKYPATISAAAVAVAGCLFAVFVRSRRGHLVHLSRCVDRSGRHKDHHHWYTR